MKSAFEFPHAVEEKIQQELLAGRIAGPFSSPPLKNLHISPIGVQPKKVPGQFRLIHHLSYPHGSSVNDGIPRELASVQYATTTDAVNLIKQLGYGCFMAKTDIKHAFRIIPIRQDQYHLLGFRWQGAIYHDKTLSMGLSSACKIFESFSTALEWIAKQKLQIPCCIHILDDFLILARTENQCRMLLQRFLHLCAELGVPIADEKTVGPASCLSFAGIELDSVSMEARLPEEKIKKCIDLLQLWKNKKKITLRELQSLVGSLNFACQVVIPGRTFLRRLINLTIGVTQPHHRIRLSRGARLDMSLWLLFLKNFNGRSFILEDQWLTSTSLSLYTDASGSWGYGAILGSKWFHGKWPTEWKKLNIIILELFPIVVALEIWGPMIANKCILLFTDNLALVEVINKQSSKDVKLMVLVRHLVLNCLRLNILFRAKHVPGSRNVLADHLSRGRIHLFQNLAPHIEQVPEVVPTYRLPEAWTLS